MDVDVFGLDRVQAPKGRILQRHAGDLDALDVHQLNQVRATAGDRRAVALVVPPPVSGAIDRAGPDDIGKNNRAQQLINWHNIAMESPISFTASIQVGAVPQHKPAGSAARA